MRQRFFVPPDGWMTQGACRGANPEIFFPIGAIGASLPQIRQAKAICGRCPVQPICLSYALDTGHHGIWGGTTDDERQPMRTAAQQNDPSGARR